MLDEKVLRDALLFSPESNAQKSDEEVGVGEKAKESPSGVVTH